MTDAWHNEMMVVCAVRYCTGRQTYVVGECVSWLIDLWPELTDKTRTIIRHDLEGAFERDDDARKSESDYKPLGWDCDRSEWERVRKLWSDRHE